MADDCAKAIGMPRDPVRHVSSERATKRCRFGRVDIVSSLRGIRYRHQVGKRLGAPGIPTPRDEIQPIAGRKRRVGKQHCVASCHSEQRGPTPAPGVPTVERTTVDPEEKRRRMLDRSPVGKQQPGANPRSVFGLRLDLGDRSRGVPVPGRSGKQPDHSRPFDSHRMRRLRPGGTKRHECAGRDIDRDVGVAEVIRGDLLHGAPIEREAKNWAAPIVVGCRDERHVIRIEGEAGRPAVPVLDDPPRGASVNPRDPDLLLGRAIGRAVLGSEEGNVHAIPADRRPLEMHALLAEENAVLSCVDIDRYDHLSTRALLRHTQRSDEGAPVGRQALARGIAGTSGAGGEILQTGKVHGIRADSIRFAYPRNFRGAYGGDRLRQLVQIEREQVRLRWPKIVVPVSNRVALMQDCRDLLVFPLLSQPGIRLDIARAGEHLCGDYDALRVARSSCDVRDATGEVSDRSGLTTSGGKQPQLRDLRVFFGGSIRASRDEQHVARSAERNSGFSFRGAGDSRRGAGPVGQHGP